MKTSALPRTRRSRLALIRLCTGLLFASASNFAAAGDVDGFNPVMPNADVRSIALDSSGRILIAGQNFESVDGVPTNSLLRLHADGTLDTSFAPAIENDEEFGALAVQADGRILTSTSSANPGIRRFEPDGTLDASFTSPVFDEVGIWQLSPAGGGKILVGGFFSTANGETAPHLVRLDSDGSIDSGFHAEIGVDGENETGVSVVRVLPTGNILVGGTFLGPDGQLRPLALLTSSGTFVPGFTDSVDQLCDVAVANTCRVAALAVQADGDILVGFDIPTANQQYIVRLHADGSIDTEFAGTVDGRVVALLALPNGKVMLGGRFHHVGTRDEIGIARLNPDGTPDTGFNSPITDANQGSIFRMHLLPGGVVLGYGAINTGGGHNFKLARFTTNGSLDGAFNPGTDAGVLTLATDPGNRTIVGGAFTMLGGAVHNHIARLTPDGRVDTGFNADANDTVNSVAIQEDGKIIAGGNFTRFDNVARNHLARMYPEGGIDATFNVDVDLPVFAVAVQADGTILIGGRFTVVNGATHYNVARLLPDGTLDSTFQSDLRGGLVTSIVVQADGSILVGGSFGVLGSTVYNQGVRRLHADGSLDIAYDPGIRPDGNFAISSLLPQGDGKLVVTGGVLAVGGNTYIGALRLNADGSPDTSFDAGLDNGVYSASLRRDGKILVGGAFTTVHGQPHGHVALLNPDGTGDAAFDFATDSIVLGIVPRVDGSIVVGGTFSTVDGQSRAGLARLSPRETFADTLLATPDRTGLRWLRSEASERLDHVRFSVSSNPADPGAWTDAGTGYRIADGWAVAVDPALLPPNRPLLLRAEGTHHSGFVSSSTSRVRIEQRVYFGDIRVTAAVAEGSGSIGPASQTVATPGGPAVFVVSPAPGWRVATVVGDTCTPTDNGDGTWMAVNVTVDCAVFASFARAGVTVVAGVGTGQGTITPLSQTLAYGDTAEFDVTPASGWATLGVSGDTCTPADNGDGTWSAANVTADCTVTAHFSLLSHIVTAVVTLGNGEVTPATQEVVHHDAASFDVTPAPDWTVRQLAGDTCTPYDAGNGTWIAEHIETDCAVEAEFELAVTLAAVAGDAQAAPVGSDFEIPLSVRVAAPNGQPLAGVEVRFDAPTSGPSAILSTDTATTNAAGVAQVALRANLEVGDYAVQAYLPAYVKVAPVDFRLTNTSADVALITSIDDGRRFARYGQVLDYQVHVGNSGTSPEYGVSVATVLSDGLDPSQAHWLCLTPTSGCSAQGDGALSQSGLTLEAGAEAIFLVSVPVRNDTEVDSVTATLHAQAGEVAADDQDQTTLVLFRGDFEGNAGEASAGSSVVGALPETGDLIELPELTIRTGAPPITVWRAEDDQVAVQAFTDGNRIWLRLATGGPRATPRLSPWSPWFGEEILLAVTTDSDDRRWITLDTSTGRARLMLDDD